MKTGNKDLVTGLWLQSPSGFEKLNYILNSIRYDIKPTGKHLFLFSLI
jgi:hypothetical protein